MMCVVQMRRAFTRYGPQDHVVRDHVPKSRWGRVPFRQRKIASANIAPCSAHNRDGSGPHTPRDILERLISSRSLQTAPNIATSPPWPPQAPNSVYAFGRWTLIVPRQILLQSELGQRIRLGHASSSSHHLLHVSASARVAPGARYPRHTRNAARFARSCTICSGAQAAGRVWTRDPCSPRSDLASSWLADSELV